MSGAHAGPASPGILQVHPTRQCNLACAHCYSSSSPRERTVLAPEVVADAIVDAAALGFGVVSLSGGEPLLYDGLDVVLAAARQVGSRVNLVSNGILILLAALRAPRRRLLPGRLEPRRTVRAAQRGTRLRATHSRQSARRGPRRCGAPANPLGSSIRSAPARCRRSRKWPPSLANGARRCCSCIRSSPRVAAPPVPCVRLRRRSGSMPCSSPPCSPRTIPACVSNSTSSTASGAPSAGGGIHGASLHEASEPRVLVLQEDGRIVPLTYGIDDTWSVVDVRHERLAAAWPAFLDDRWPRLRRHLRRACAATAAGCHGEVVDLHALVRRYADPHRRSVRRAGRAHRRGLGSAEQAAARSAPAFRRRSASAPCSQ